MWFATITGVPPWQNALFAGNLLAFVALLVRVVSLRLTRSYPALIVWLVFNVAASIPPWILAMDMRFYRWFFVCAESSEVLLFCWMVLELYAGVLRGLPGLATVARRIIQIVLPVTVVASLSLLAGDANPRGPVMTVYVASRVLITALVLFVLAITAFMSWFPIRVPRNTLVYLIGFAVYLLPSGASLFLRNSGHAATWLGGVVGMIACTVCLLFWAAGLSRTGETTLIAPGRVFHPADEARLLTQLESINRTLLRTKTEAAQAPHSDRV